RFLGADDRNDVPRGSLIQGFLVGRVGFYVEDLGDEFLRLLHRIEGPAARFQRARIDTQGVKLAVRIGLNLESEWRQRFRRVWLARFFLVLLRIDPLDRRAIERAGEKPADAVQQELDPDVLAPRTGKHRLDVALQGAPSQQLSDK